jgi:hypothetical protein
MLQVFVFIALCVAIVALFEGFVKGLDIITFLFKGIITFVVGGLGVLLGIGLGVYALFAVITGG